MLVIRNGKYFTFLVTNPVIVDNLRFEQERIRQLRQFKPFDVFDSIYIGNDNFILPFIYPKRSFTRPNTSNFCEFLLMFSERLSI